MTRSLLRISKLEINSNAFKLLIYKGGIIIGHTINTCISHKILVRSVEIYKIKKKDFISYTPIKCFLFPSFFFNVI